MKLNDWLAENSMTKTKLCALLSIDNSLPYKWARGIRRIGPKTLKALMKLTKNKISHIDDVRYDR